MLFLWWCACQTDPLAGMGLDPAPPPAAPAPEPAVQAPTTPPAPAADLDAGAAKEPAAAPPAGAPPADPHDFNPISIPQGPREGGGVHWEGVSNKFTPDTVPLVGSGKDDGEHVE